ncbi:MAG: ribonuclease H [Saprospiraceae bacterium]|nr:MAG: ribonuclease H [Saprospiraceae bacterium]
MAKGKKYYVVWEGNNPGIYNSWTECQLQIKGYPNARYKSFKTEAEAQAAFQGNYQDAIQKSDKSKPKVSHLPDSERGKIVWNSLAVDAACSGNPGVMEYQGVNTSDGSQIFHQKFSLGTNNIGEFLAIVHALAMLKKQGKDTPIYTDSRTAMAWVRKKKANTNLKKTASTAQLYQLITRAEAWLKNNTYTNKILKWDTDNWGEIPADFGRK